MIRTLKRIHLLAFALIAVALALLLPLILSTRPAPPKEERTIRMAPAVRAEAGVSADSTVRVASCPPPAVELIRGDQHLELEFALERSLESPDLLLYWSRDPAAGDTPPASALLLGPWTELNGRVLSLPPGARQQPSHLWLYSLGHARIVGRLTLPASSPTGGTRRKP